MPEYIPQTKPRCSGRRVWQSLAGFLVLAVSLHAALPEFDFADPAQATAWTLDHDIPSAVHVPGGFDLTIHGEDPYLSGPARDYPAGQQLWLVMRLKSAVGGTAQVFYYPANSHPTEDNSVRFVVKAGDWADIKVRLPALGPNYRLRLDPPGNGGSCVLGRLGFDIRRTFPAPDWPRPMPPQLKVDAARISSGELAVVHDRNQFGGFLVQVADETMAAGNTQTLVGYIHHDQARWFAVNSPAAKVTVQQAERHQVADANLGGTLTARTAVRDPDGGEWDFELTFKLNSTGTLLIESSARCSQEREVLYLPLFTLLPGLGSYGTNKSQALLAGVEYLENEPSSSTADLHAPASNRQVADTAKLTFPLMAVSANDRYLGVAWKPAPALCAVFDTPDRLFNSGAQVIGLIFPGSDGLNRDEHSLIPYAPVRMPADRSVKLAGLLMGGRGRSVIPAVQEYVKLQGLPPRPEIPGGAPAYLELAARGWLDSEIRDGDLYRHAAPGFASNPASDAALFEEWLAERVADTSLKRRLIAASQAAIARVNPVNYNTAQIGHCRQPVPALVFGAMPSNLTQAEQRARAALKRFEPDGAIRYHAPTGGMDYGKTHWAPDANGLTAAVLQGVLQDAAFTGNRELIEAGVRQLRALTTRHPATVPRGAQTWEIPLHTPDILASGYLVNCYLLGYELTRDTAFLEQAKYWAWTGVPFVYLAPPTDQAIGLYATIPVLGATGWVAPNWIGLPVQWCGLVYAQALYELARHDPKGPWRELADGIVISGIQQSYPASNARYVGLLPDSFTLQTQSRNGPNINPATLLVPAARCLEQSPTYQFEALPRHGLGVHVPGKILGVQERDGAASFTVRGWPARPHFVLITGLKQPPVLRLNGLEAPVTAPHEYQTAAGRLILAVQGETKVELEGIGRGAGPGPK